MQTRQLSLVFSLLLTLCLFNDTQAQQAGRIESMKLLTSDVGWAATNKKLFWTTHGGAQWKDITPKPSHKGQGVSSVFFLDSSTGWVLLSCGDGRDPKVDDVCFEFASTTDAGQTWSIVHPKIADPVPQSAIEDGQGFSGVSFLNFADAQHGWAILKRSLNTTRSSGEMLRTADGGRTWAQLPHDSLPMADHFRFVSAKDGWIAGGGQPESDLYVTHDGGDSWSQVVVKPPTTVKIEVWPPAENGVWPDYRLPFFVGPARGFLIASYWDGSGPTNVLFSTDDGGTTWKFERAIPRLDGAVAIVGSTLFVCSTSQSMDRLTLEILRIVDKGSLPARVTAGIHGIPIQHYNLGAGYDSLDMISDVHGWLLADRLLVTVDGGATWKDITPGEAAPPNAVGSENQKKASARATVREAEVRATRAMPTGSRFTGATAFITSFCYPSVPYGQ